MDVVQREIWERVYQIIRKKKQKQCDTEETDETNDYDCSEERELADKPVTIGGSTPHMLKQFIGSKDKCVPILSSFMMSKSLEHD